MRRPCAGEVTTFPDTAAVTRDVDRDGEPSRTRCYARRVAGQSGEKRTQIGGTGAPNAAALRRSIASDIAQPVSEVDDGARATEFSMPPEQMAGGSDPAHAKVATPVSTPPNDRSAPAPVPTPAPSPSTPPRATGARPSMPRITGPVASTNSDALIGQVLADRYEIQKKLGEG